MTLQGDKIAFDFPNLISSDYPIAFEVIALIHDAFPRAFPEFIYEKLEIQTLQHMELLDKDEAVDLFLDRYKVVGMENAFPSPVVSQPAIRFAVISQDQNWQCGFTVERSLLSARALFAALNISLRNVNPSSPPFPEKVEKVMALERSCFALVGLERADGPST